MRDVNFRQDFLLWQRFLYENNEGQILDFGIPTFNFKIFYWTTSRSDAYTVSVIYKDGVPKCTNCKIYEDKLIVVFDHYKLSPGELRAEMIIDVPSGLFPDGFRNDPIRLDTGVRLVHGPTSTPTMAEAKVILPYIVGKDGKDGKSMTYDDLTEEQKEELAQNVAKYVDTDLGEFEDLDFAEIFQD